MDMKADFLEEAMESLAERIVRKLGDRKDDASPRKDRLLNTTQAAEILQIKPAGVRRLIKNKRLGASKPTNEWRIPLENVDKLMDEHSSQN